jgi:DNA-binding response OmpR family regulator
VPSDLVAPPSPHGPSAPVASSPPSAPVARHAQPRVLLIEEHEDTCELYSMWLTQCGFVVDVAPSAPAAFAAVRAAPPDIVVVELMVPGGGVALVRALRDLPRLDGAVLVVLTTQACGQMSQAALAAGADAYLVKPCGVPRLAEAVLAASRDRLTGSTAGADIEDRRRAADLSAAIAERLDRGAPGSFAHQATRGH